MMRMRSVLLLLAASCPGSLLAQAALADEVRVLVERAFQADNPVESANSLWQATCAAHGEIDPLVADLRAKLEGGNGDHVARVLCAVLRYEGRPEDGLSALDAIAVANRTNADLLLRAELLDTLGRGEDAGAAYEALLERPLEPALRRRILFRRALVGKDSIEQLKQFAAREDSDRDQKNQAAIILALRDQPLAALDLYEVHGEGTQRFRQLVRLAEWAIAADQFDRAQQFAWQAVECAKMRRDRRYALTVVVSACRAGGLIDDLLQRFESSDDLDKDARQVWIDLLRDEGRVDDALRLFREEGDGQWTPALRRQLLEICRETGKDDVLVAQFRELIGQDPGNLEWRSGLSRHYLENGERELAKQVWDDFGSGQTSPGERLDAAHALTDLGLDEPALHHAGVAAEHEPLREAAQLFVVKLHVTRGRFDEAVQGLEAIEAASEGTDAVLVEVAGIYERIDRLDRSVAVLDRMRAAHGNFLGTDLDMKYALLLSKVDREADALKVWRSLWNRVRSTPRGRYVEDRMMTVAARLGVLAKIAIELEDKLDAGTADPVDVELLVRLYVKVGDSAAATEITEQSLKDSGADGLEIIRKKATIYLACHDYREYENLIEQLIVRDPDNRIDHMRELTLSRLERGRRAQAIEDLPKLRAASDDGGIADEFEAGIFQLAGLKGRALRSYTKGLGRYPDRIDTHLLVANLMRETGREMEAARRFQYLAATAARDDLFTIAIDGILNLRAQQGTNVPDDVVDWAMRVTLERLAERSHRFYLHRLAADLAEERNDMPMSIRTLTAGIPVAGERRTALLREILGKVRSLDKNARTMFGGSRAMKISPDWDAEPYVRIGRRLLGQGEVVPPQVFMDLAAVFLHVDAVPDAMRTFSRAAELLDRSEVHRQAAAVLEDGERYDAALKFYRRLLSVDADDVTLLAKIGRLEELAGRDDAARAVYRSGLLAGLRQKAVRVHVATEEEPDPDDLQALYGGQRNVDTLTATLPKLVEGLLVTLGDDHVDAMLEELRRGVDGDLAAIGERSASEVQTIDSFPRLQARAHALRRLAVCFGRGAVSEQVDAGLLQRFATDRELAKATIGFRADRGFHVVARRLLRGSSFASDAGFAWLLVEDRVDGAVAPAVAAARVLPLLATDRAQLRAMLDNVDTASLDAESVGSVPVLLGACALVGAKDAGERLARAAVRISAAMNQRERITSRNEVRSILALARRIEPELEDRLWQYRVERTAANGAKNLADLQYEVGNREFALDAERIEEMLKAEVANSAKEQFGIRGLGLLHFLPEGRRAALVRELYTIAPRSKRLTVLSESGDFLTEPLSDGFVEWYRSVFEREYKEADPSARRTAGGGYVRQENASVRVTRARLETALSMGGSHREWLRLVEVVCDSGDSPALEKMLRAGIPDMVTRDDLAGLIPNRPKELDLGQVRSAVDSLCDNGAEALCAQIVQDKLEQQPRHEALRYMQWLLRTRTAGASQFVTEMAERSSNDAAVLERVADFQRDRGRLVEACEVYERLIELGGKQKKAWQSRLRGLRRKLGKKARPEAEAAPRPGRPGAPIAAVNLATLGRGRAGPAQIAALAKEKDPKQAALKLRRIWRSEPNRRIVYSPFGARANVALTAQNIAPLMGKEFAVDEARRVLRLLVDAAQLETDGLLPALLKLLPVADAAATTEELLALLEGGDGGSAEAVRLQVLLADAELADEGRARIVQQLLARREVPDKQRLRGIGDELARTERGEAAAALYRLSVLTGVEPLYYFPGRGRGKKPAETLAEIRKNLGGELGDRTALLWIEDQLAVKPSIDLMVAAMQVWRELFDTEQLQQRVTALRDQIHAQQEERFSSFSYQDPTELSAVLCEALVQSGQHEAAVAEFRELVCEPEPDMYGRRPPRNAKAGAERAEKMLALDYEGREAWLRTVAAAMLAWHADGKLRAAAATLGLLGSKLGGTPAADLLPACVAALERLAPDDTRAEQQLAKVRRAQGEEAVAFAIEKRLLRQRRLPIEDHARVIGLLHASDGAAAAFDAGQRALEYTDDRKLIEVMIGLAEELGDKERADGWRQQIAPKDPEGEAKSSEAAKGRPSKG